MPSHEERDELLNRLLAESVARIKQSEEATAKVQAIPSQVGRFLDDLGRQMGYSLPFFGPELRQWHEERGLPPIGQGAQIAGDIAGTLAQFAGGGAIAGTAGNILGRIPQVANIVPRLPAALQTQRAANVARGVATGVAATGIQKAADPEVGLRDLAQNVGFLGGGALASDLTRAAIAARAPGMNRLLEAGLSGAAAGAGGTIAAAPFMDQPLHELPRDALINAAALAIFQAGMTYMTPHQPTAEFMRAGRKAGEAVQRAAEGTQAGRSQQVAAARRDFNSAIDEMYHVARQARPGMPMKMTPEARAQFEAIFNRASAVPPPVNVTPPRPTPLPPSQAAQDVPVAQPVQPVQPAIASPGPTQPAALASMPPPAPIVPVAPTIAPEPQTYEVVGTDKPHVLDVIRQEDERRMVVPRTAMRPTAEPPTIEPKVRRGAQAGAESIPEGIPQATAPEGVEPPKRGLDDRSESALATLTKEIERNVGTIKQIDAGEEHYNRSAFVNSIAGYIKRAADRGDIEVARDALNFVREQQKDMSKPVFTDRHGIWTYPDKAADRIQERQEDSSSTRPTGLSRQEVGTEPQVALEMSPDVAVVIEDVRAKLSGLKRPNSTIAAKRLDVLGRHNIDISDAMDALDEYRDMDPSDFEDRQEYAEERARAWQEFLDALDELEMEEPWEITADPSGTLPVPPIAGSRESTQPLPPLAPRAQGNTETVFTERGTSLDAQYALVDAGDVIASHDTDLRVNPAFPQELQPRDRSRTATEHQLREIISKFIPARLGKNTMVSDGAPLVAPDGIVESGNARVIALRRMYERSNPNIERYKTWLKENASSFGLDPQHVDSLESPVLVRIRRSEVNREQFVKDANEPNVAAMSAVEKAMSDAQSITPELLARFTPSDSGDIFAASNRDFVAGFISRVVSPAERGEYMQSDGQLSSDGRKRIQNAVFASAYGDPTSLIRLAEDPDANLRNVTNALLNVAPKFVDLADRVGRQEFRDGFDLAPELVEAANQLSKLRDKGTTVDVFLDQTLMFGEELNDLSKAILEVLDKNVRSSKRMTAILGTYIDMVKALGMPSQTGLFGDEIELPTKDELFAAAVLEATSRGQIAGGAQLEIFAGEAGGDLPSAEAVPGTTSATGGEGEGAGHKRAPGAKEVRGLPEATSAQLRVDGGAAHKRPSSSTRAIVTRKQAIDYIEKEFMMPIREGRLRMMRARGEFNLHSHVTRIRRAEDFRAITHEFGHFLSETLPLEPMLYPELQPMGAALYPEADVELQREEGAAEFFSLYFSHPDSAKAAAPTFYDDFEAKLKEDGVLGAKVQQVQKLMTTLYNQTGTAAIKAMIAKEEAKETPFLKPVQKVYTDWVDDVHPLFRLMQYALGGENVKSEWDVALRFNPYVLARLSRGRFAKASGFVTKAQLSPEFEEVGPSLEKILKPIASRADDFEAYLIAKRAVELHAREKRPGVELANARLAIRELEDNTFKTAARQLYAYQSVLIDWLVDAGMLNKDAADVFRGLNKYYVPFYRYFGEETASGGFSGSRLKTGNLPKPIKSIKGSTRSIISPLQSILRNTYALIDVAERNRVARAVLHLARENPGIGWLVEEVKTPTEPVQVPLELIRKDLELTGIPTEILDEADLQNVATLFRPVSFARLKETKENILTVWDKGKPVFLQVHPDIYRAMQFIDQPASNWLLRLLSFPTRLLRAGATLNPEFAARNPVRDATSALMHSKFKFTPIIGPARAMFHLLKGEAVGGDKLYTLWTAGGGAQSTLVSLNREYLQKDLRKLMGEKSKSEKTLEVIRSPLTFLEGISSTLEEVTRLSMMGAGVQEQDLDQPDPEGIRWAAYGSREGTVDFQRAGRYGRQANQVKAFFNAAIQGTDQAARLVKRDPVGYLIKAFLYITLPSIALYLLNKDDPRYQELPRWRRDLYYAIPGKDGFIFVPKAFELGVIFGTLPERILEYIETEDPKAFEEFADTFFNSVTPGDPRSPLDWLPDAFTPAVEVWANRNSFTERPIVPRSEQDLLPEAQYGPHTTDTAKRIAWLFGLSPRNVEHLVTGYGAGLGRQVLRTIDMISGHQSVNPIFRPFGGDFFVSAASMDEFYEELAHLESTQRTASELAKRGLQAQAQADELRLKYLRGVRDDLAAYRRMNRTVLEDRNMSIEEKRRMSSAISVRMVNLARVALGRAPVQEPSAVPMLPPSRSTGTAPIRIPRVAP